MARRFYSVSVRWGHFQGSVNPIESVLTSHGDWMRFSGQAWLSVSTTDVATLSAAIKATLGPDDLLLVIGADPNAFGGWAPPWVWEWIRTRV